MIKYVKEEKTVIIPIQFHNKSQYIVVFKSKNVHFVQNVHNLHHVDVILAKHPVKFL